MLQAAGFRFDSLSLGLGFGALDLTCRVQDCPS